LFFPAARVFAIRCVFDSRGIHNPVPASALLFGAGSGRTG
jgi:hypothetical protein